MQKKIVILVILGIFFGVNSCSKKEKIIYTNGPETVAFRVLPFKLSEVKLLDGPFMHATELNIQSLLNYQPDRFLAKFRLEAGLKPKAEHYHGWEDNTIAGHSLGHYLSACALMYQTSGDERFLNRVNYIVDELEACQLADGNGYIGAFPDGKKILEEEVAKGIIKAKGFDLNGIWVPYYTQHKIMAGLFEAYDLCGNQKALQINIRFANWLATIIENLTEDQIQEMLNCEHGGINESLAELYAKTGNSKYLELSKKFHHKAILDPLLNEIDILPGKHGNTQIPKLVGIARRYELTGDLNDRKTATFFWQRVVNHHSYVTGGHGNHEYFGPPDTLRNRLSNETTETCNVYNMLKLSHHLFLWEAKTEVADFYERAMFNQILSSQHPGDGRVIYNLSLEMGGFKEYQNPEWFTCCIGTGMENHSKYGRNIYFRNSDEIYVTQFIASEVNWKEKNTTLIQKTNFPEEPRTSIRINCDNPVKFVLKIRYPAWAENGINVKINGKEKYIGNKPGSFIEISKKWNNGDLVEVEFPFSLQLETMPDDTNRVAIKYGPLVLAGDLGEVNDPNAYDPQFVPVLMTDNRNPATWMSRIKNETNTFKLLNIGLPRNIVFKPFYKMHDRRYSVYFDMFSKERWDLNQKEYQQKLMFKKQLEKATIDFFQPGEMQPERDHNFTEFKSWTGENKNRKFRETDRGGWMACELKIDENKPANLVVEYWGGYTGSKTFDILVDETIIATENISNKKPGEFINEIYSIPDSLLVGNNKIEVKFVPHDGHRAGPVFGVRTIRKTN